MVISMSSALRLCILITTTILTTFLFVNFSFTSDKIGSAGKYEVTKQEAEQAVKMAGLQDFNNLPLEAKKLIVQKLIYDKVLEEYAKKEKINEQIDVLMGIRSILVAKYIEKHSIYFEILAKKKYDETTVALQDKKTYTFSHILVPNKTEANKVYKILFASKNWQLEFKKLARAKSIDIATAKNGGVVGSVPEMQLPSDFLQRIQNAKPGTLIKPFKTNLGYHVATVDKVEALNIEPYEKVKQLFIAKVLQEETERLAKEKLADNEISFDFNKEEVSTNK